MRCVGPGAPFPHRRLLSPAVPPSPAPHDTMPPVAETQLHAPLLPCDSPSFVLFKILTRVHFLSTCRGTFSKRSSTRALPPTSPMGPCDLGSHCERQQSCVPITITSRPGCPGLSRQQGWEASSWEPPLSLKPDVSHLWPPEGETLPPGADCGNTVLFSDPSESSADRGK